MNKTNIRKVLKPESKNKYNMSDLKDTIQKLIDFRDQRDWKQFHNSKDLALAISIEAGELLELFLWREKERQELQYLSSLFKTPIN